MLKLNIERLFTIRGISKPISFLTKNGFSYTTAHRLVKGEMIRYDNDIIEKLCISLNCTPNDLFEWQPKKDAEGHRAAELSKLIRKNESIDLSRLAKTLSIERVEEIANAFLTEEKKNSNE